MPDRLGHAWIRPFRRTHTDSRFVETVLCKEQAHPVGESVLLHVEFGVRRRMRTGLSVDEEGNPRHRSVCGDRDRATRHQSGEFVRCPEGRREHDPERLERTTHVVKVAALRDRPKALCDVGADNDSARVPFRPGRGEQGGKGTLIAAAQDARPCEGRSVESGFDPLGEVSSRSVLGTAAAHGAVAGLLRGVVKRSDS